MTILSKLKTMMSVTTAEHRVNSLLALSDEIYPVIGQRVGDEIRARRTLRLGVHTIATCLEDEVCEGEAGGKTHALLRNELADGGLPLEHPLYAPFLSYRSLTTFLPDALVVETVNPRIATLANSYSDVLRVTTLNNEYESDATHAVHLAALALPYAAEVYPDLDHQKIAMYCFVHDILEAYVGDVPTLGISDQDMHKKHVAEMGALVQLRKDFGQTWPQFVKTIETYEALDDAEARYVKTFDKLDPGFTHFANDGKQLIDFYGYTSRGTFLDAVDEATERITPYGSDFAELLADRLELTERIADHIQWPN